MAATGLKKKGPAMNTHPLPPNPPTHRTRNVHPLLILAALAVILFCAVGTAAIMGWLPSSKGGTAATRSELSEADRAALSASLQQPGAAGTTAGAMAPGALPPAYPAQGAVGSYVPATPSTTAPMPAVPPSTIAPTTASTYPPGYVAEGGTAYGSSAQGATASGYTEPAPAIEGHPKAKTTTRVAQESSNWCGSCGNVESIRQITSRAQGSGVGAGAGAILGGLLGNQVGSGHGRQLATVAGAVGGAVVGNQVEGNMKANHSYEIRVRLDDGTLRTFHQQSVPQWRTGDRVRIVKGSLRAA
jgi:outer membrane lipoprotein SlyB